MCTCNIVAKPHCRQGDDYKVGRLQKRPLLHFLENKDWHCNKQQATQQDGQDSWDHTHNGGTDTPFLSEHGGVRQLNGQTCTVKMKNTSKALFRVWPGRASLFWQLFSSAQFPSGPQLQQAGYQTSGFPPGHRKCRTVDLLLSWERCFQNLETKGQKWKSSIFKDTECKGQKKTNFSQKYVIKI